MSNELTYEIDPGETVTHFYTPDNKLLCLDLECATKGMTASASDARDFDDVDCHGSYLTCDSCSEYIFPEAAAESDAETDAIMRSVAREYRYHRPITRDDLDAYEPGDPKRITLERLL